MTDALWGVVLGGGIGVGGTLLGVFADSWMRRGERRAAVREKRRVDAAAAVGPAIAALRDMDPNANVGVLRGNPRAAEALREKWEKWLSAQGGLEILAATHPGTQVAELCEAVITGGTTLLARLHFAINEGDAKSERWWEGVVALREQAMADARSLIRAVLSQPA